MRSGAPAWHTRRTELSDVERCRYEVHILDTNPLSASANGWLEDTSKVEKYMMSDDAYRQRDGTYRKYKEMRRQVLPSQLFCDLHEGFCLQVREVLRSGSCWPAVARAAKQHQLQPSQLLLRLSRQTSAGGPGVVRGEGAVRAAGADLGAAQQARELVLPGRGRGPGCGAAL